MMKLLISEQELERGCYFKIKKINILYELYEKIMVMLIWSRSVFTSSNVKRPHRNKNSN